MTFKEWFINEGVKWPPPPYRGYTGTVCDQSYLAKLESKSPSCFIDKARGKGSHWTVFKKDITGTRRITTIPTDVTPKLCSNIYNDITVNCG